MATQGPAPRNDLKAGAPGPTKAAKLDAEIGARREEEQVATMLGQMLRASSFERWLCTEALDSLVAEASVTLMELSGGQYQLDRDSGTSCSSSTTRTPGAAAGAHAVRRGDLPGVAGPGAGAVPPGRRAVRRDAGFELDVPGRGVRHAGRGHAEIVATTLERLAADSDRMVGIITHVAALAERVPVRFIVSRTGATSALRKERV